MIALLGPILFLALILWVVRLQKRGMAGWKALLFFLGGAGLIVLIMFGVLFFGFRNFG